jgi:hypothetical protein
MSAQAQRLQLTLFAVEAVDNVFGITSRDHTCVKCGHAMMHVEDSEGAYYGVPPKVIDEVCEVCSNEKCEVYHDHKRD